MKLSKVELKGLRQMIKETSTLVLNKYEKMNSENTSNKDIVFIGDSMIEYFKLDKYLPDMDALNRGIAGATTKLILDNFNTILGNTSPKKVFVSIGSNDLVLLEASVDEAYSGVVDVLNHIKTIYPDTTIYYLSTTPVVSTTNKLYKKLYIGGRTNGQLKSLNYKVYNYAKTHGIHYIHQFDNLLDDKLYLDTNLTADGIHLNAKGYQIYAKTIMDYLNK